MSQGYQYRVNYACKHDDDQFIHAPGVTRARRIRWIQRGVGRLRWEREETLLEMLAGNEEDVWLWVDGDEAALPEPAELELDKLPYLLAAKALQTRQASKRFENRKVAQIRQRVQYVSCEIRQAAILWLVLTSKAVKKLDSEHGLMDREEWDLLGLIRDWWDNVGDQLPEAPTKEFEEAMEKEGHTCHIEYYESEPKVFSRWLYVQSVLFPEYPGARWNRMKEGYRNSQCKACCNYVSQHYYLQAQQFYAPSPYAVLLATVLHTSSSLEDKGSLFLEWIAALSSRQSHKKLISSGHQLCKTLRSKRKRQSSLGNVRYALWINSYPTQCHLALSRYSSKTWKLADPILNSPAGLSSTSETIPDFATWLATAIWTICTRDESLTVGRTAAIFYPRLEYTINRFYSIWGLPTDIHPPNTDAVESFRHKARNHACWDTSKHDPGWYASAVSYLNDDNDPEFVPHLDTEDPTKTACEECLVDQFVRALSKSHPQPTLGQDWPVGPHIGPQSTISSILTSGPVLDGLDFHILRFLRLQEPWKLLCKLNLSPWASHIMKIVQNELDDQEHGEYRRKCIRLLRKMAQSYGILPPSFLLSDLAKAGNHAVDGGGFSDIWKGKLGGRDVCIKVLRVFTTANMREKLVKQFCHEAVLWGQFKHPNILPFLGVSFDLFQPSFCLVSPWMENGNILQFLEQNSTYDRMIVIREVAEGLKYLHAFNPPVVHGDIRGANILVASNLRCCLADFGLSAVVESQIFTTSSNSIKGTTRWMAPEVLLPPPNKSSKAAPLRDIYAFACTVLELCTGQVPFHEDRLDITVVHKVLHGERPRRPSSDIWFPDEVWDLVQMCWREDPTTRPTARKVIELIGSIEKSLSKK